MKQNYKRVPTKFGAETAFEITPSAPLPFQAKHEAEFERLKEQLLANRLTGGWGLQFASALRHAANEAAALAWVTRYPLLVFPVLFEEKAAAALRRGQLQQRIRRRSRQLLAA
jgi:hypothetical protein